MARTGRPKTELTVTEQEREQLVLWSRRAKSSQALALRSKIVLACAKGTDNKDVAAQLKCAVATVGKWRSRFVAERLDGLMDEPRPGRPATISVDQVEAVVVATLEETPRNATHWSRASMAKRSGLSKTTIGRIWKAFELKPHRAMGSSCPRTRCSGRRSTTWSAFTWIRLRARWCCAWTRSPRCKPWPGPARCCR
jgi:hypothetical protein